jgi:hypothetical protein
MWQIINYHDLIKNGLEGSEAQSIVDETTYLPINEKYCVVKTDHVEYLITQENGIVINCIESGLRLGAE